MWYYKNNILINDQVPVNSIGFIYRITCINETAVQYGKFYIGRKMMISNRKKKLTLKEKTLTPRKKFKREIKSTNWENYWGSNDELKIDITLLGEHSFKREIIEFFETRVDISFYELYYQIKEDVLFKNSYNRHIANTKFFKGKVNEIS